MAEKGMIRSSGFDLDTPYGRWASLIQRRKEAPPEMQKFLGPKEHAAYAEYLVSRNPLWALPLLAMVPGYTAAKGAGMLSGRSPATLEELSEGYKGIWRGLGIDWE